MATQALDVSGVAAPATGADGGRFATYVAELREFFAGRGMKFGAPEDLAGFVTALNEPGTFADELGSLTRSVLYREQGVVALPELLEMITVAMGGARIAEAAEQVREPVRELLVFVGKAMKNGRGPALVESAAPKAAPNGSVAEPEHFGLLVDAETIAAETESPETAIPIMVAEIDPATNSGTVPHQHVSKDFYARARSLSPEVEETAASALPAGLESELAAISPVKAIDAEIVGEQRSAITGAASDASSDSQDDKPTTGSMQWRRALAICAGMGLMVAAVMLLRPWLPSPIGTRDEAVVVAVGPAETEGDLGNEKTDGTAAPNLRIGSGAVNISPTINSGVRAGAVYGVHSADGGVNRNANDSGAAVSDAAEGVTPLDRGKVARLDTQRPNTEGAEMKGPVNLADSSSAEGTMPAGTMAGQRHDMPARTLPPIKMMPGRRAGVYTVSSGVMAGNLVSATPPDYPRLAGLLHIEGQVILQAVVSRNGRVVDTHVLRGHRLLRGAAEDAVRRWRYRPYVVNGQATDVATIVTVNFRRR
jgi:TonB family protein